MSDAPAPTVAAPALRTFTRIRELRAAVGALKRVGARIAVVPTMGALHDGHLSLAEAARTRADVVVMTLFVNPLQFGPAEDLARYPRDLEGDREKARGRGVDFMFAPTVEEMYPAERVVSVVPRGLDERWEGAVRPGHFAGVLTVVTKLLNIVQPDVAVFGRKDLQQAALIRAMVRDLDIPVDVVVAPIVREPDGLAMSSRNAYLSADERARAVAVPRSLEVVRRLFREGERDTARLEAAGRLVLREAELPVDYLACVAPDSLEPVEVADERTVVQTAVRVGRTRLLDNLVLGEDGP